MSFEDVDTLVLLFDKLRYIFGGYDPIIESYDKMYSLYKQGQISEREFFEKATDTVLKYSALEFLALRALFEIKKSLDVSVHGRYKSISGELMTGSSNHTHSGPQHTVSSFIMAKKLAKSSDSVKNHIGDSTECISCGTSVMKQAKFCKNCGKRLLV